VHSLSRKNNKITLRRILLYETLKLVVELKAYFRLNFLCELQQIAHNITMALWDLGIESHDCDDYCLFGQRPSTPVDVTDISDEHVASNFSVEE
jgi:hypothetical protein